MSHVRWTGRLAGSLTAAILLTVAPAVAYEGGPTAFAAPRPWGKDLPEWH